jgi:Asp-tRNA(Asn)/Glu-tRNA(Gln) amidotransferase C subunit
MSGRAIIRAVHNPLPGARPKVARPAVVPSPRIAALLEKPTWSVKSLLPSADSQSTSTVTPKQLHHLLRLSALPQPKDEQEEAEMLKTLESQIHFVREIQKVDTTGVEPLRAIRDESPEGIQEQTITLADLQEHLDAEEIVGRNGHIKRRVKEDPEAKEVEDWDPFAMSEGQEKNKGRYFFVRKEKRVEDKQV